ncbi:VOC family protein [Tritonibacter scottomollicae]|uniref:VOC family protein n=1 Tax=Tritonibacter scottomollicae TaxID=483013 RepID=UPI003AA8B957
MSGRGARPARQAHGGRAWWPGRGGGSRGAEQGGSRYRPPARRAHPALLVSDLAKLVARLGKAGIRFKPGKDLEGYVRGDIADPFGNRIELMQRV